MARPRRDGSPSRQPIKKKFSDSFITGLKPESRLLIAYDTHQRGLAITVQSKSGKKTYKAIYFVSGLPRWFHIGDADAIGLADARKLASRVMFDAAQGKDPVAEREAERSKGTFEELATRYREEHAKKRNRSWRQADKLVQRFLLPKWGKLQANAVARSDVKSLVRGISAPIIANQVLAAASAIFSWAIKEGVVGLNPCSLVGRNPTRSRERVLSESEFPLFWQAFDGAGLMDSTALKLILLTGQRPGEVANMHRSHFKDGWWELPGSPVPALNWPGTKNGANHRVWLSKPVQELLAAIDGDGGSVFGKKGDKRLATAMRSICEKLKVERLTPHDLRRSNGTTITSLGFGRDSMNRVQNHREGGIGDVYDRHQYSDENKRVMEAVAARILALADGQPAPNVVHAKFGT
jgi:integrase